MTRYELIKKGIFIEVTGIVVLFLILFVWHVELGIGDLDSNMKTLIFIGVCILTIGFGYRDIKN